MTPEEYHLVCRVFLQACELPPAERPAFLDEACRECPELRGAVEAMLAQDDREGLEAGVSHDFSDSLLLPTIGAADETHRGASSARPYETVAGYELLDEIGRGAMGVVYRARQQTPNRVVALKMIRAGQFASPSDIQRFHAEAQAAAELDHDGIVPVYEVGEHRGEPFFSMKIVEGESLAQWMQRDDPNLCEALDMFRQICHAVAHAHQRGVVHRDLKPSNILIDEEGRARVTDFGLAKCLNRDSSLTSHGDVMGTPGYMSPEQAMGDADRVTAATDVYSLGAMLYQLLTGRTPIQADRVNLIGTLQMIQEHDIVPPKSLDRRVPRDLNTICVKCLEKDPKERYSSAAELAADLDRFVEGEAIQAKPLGVLRNLMRWARQQPGLAAAWIAVAIFYPYHLICYYVLQMPELTTRFHLVSTGVAVAICLEAWFFQRMLLRSAGKPLYLFLWVTTDVTLVTILLLSTDGATSPLALFYHVMVAGSVLRFRTDLIGYVTGLSVAGYLLHVAMAHAWSRDVAPKFREVMPFVLTLLLIGMIQYFALRRSRACYDLAARKRFR